MGRRKHTRSASQVALDLGRATQTRYIVESLSGEGEWTRDPEEEITYYTRRADAAAFIRRLVDMLSTQGSKDKRHWEDRFRIVPVSRPRRGR